MYEEMRELYGKLKDIGNTKGMLMAAAEMRKQIELIDSLLSKNSRPHETATQVVGGRSTMRDLTGSIEKAVESLERDGTIEFKQVEKSVTLKPGDCLDVEYKVHEGEEEKND